LYFTVAAYSKAKIGLLLIIFFFLTEPLFQFLVCLNIKMIRVFFSF
jgi:hypothetical protein